MKKNKTLYEFLNSKNGFIESLEFPEGLMELENADVKTILMVRYGDKPIHSIYNKMTGEEVAKYINNVYNQKWKWLIDFVAQGFDVGEVNRKKIDEEFSNEVTGKTDGTSKNLESAFNIDEDVNVGSQENISENEGTNSGNRTRNESYQSYYTSLQQLNNIERTDIINLIITDIQKELCLKIY